MPVNWDEQNWHGTPEEFGAIEALDTFLRRYREEGGLGVALDEDTENNITGMSEDAFNAYGAMFDTLRNFFGVQHT